VTSPFLGELFGTATLILLGDGVVAGVLLARSKAHQAGWIVITAGRLPWRAAFSSRRPSEAPVN
jgi:glycerol uptake facilitator-like aquaporin